MHSAAAERTAEPRWVSSWHTALHMVLGLGRPNSSMLISTAEPGWAVESGLERATHSHCAAAGSLTGSVSHMPWSCRTVGERVTV